MDNDQAAGAIDRVISRSVKIMITHDGFAHVTASNAHIGYDGKYPVIEVIEVPDDVSDVSVLVAYERCVIYPIMHANLPIPWKKISNATQGEIIRLVGRPKKDEADKSVRINITLSPEALAKLDERGEGRSQAIERLILESAAPNE